MQQSKRRRLDDASRTLSQPFRSPFKSPLKTTPETETNAHAHFPSLTPSKTEQRTLLSTRSSLPTPIPVQTNTPPRRLIPTSRSRPSSQLLALQKNHTHLLNRLSAARSGLETAHQALKIESSDRERELEALIVKWRVASRVAAEEVFAGARDKVNKMGGVAAMKDRERQKQGMAWGWDARAKNTDGDGDGDMEDAGQEGRTDSRLEAEGTQQSKGGAGAREEEEYSWDEEGYTMDMMLRTLNIDLDVIGYERGLQKWIE